MYLESQLQEIVPIILPSSELSSTSFKTCATPIRSSDCLAITRIIIGDVSIEVDPTLPTEFLCSLIKAVRYALEMPTLVLYLVCTSYALY